MQTAADVDLLTQTLKALDLDLVRLAPDQPFSARADLIVLDPTTLRQRRSLILGLRTEAQPTLLPVLLLAQTSQVYPELLTSALGDLVEDLLRLPTTGPEIRARVHNLLRLRALSRQQTLDHKVTQQALEGISRAWQTLHACNELMLHETSEDALIGSVCEIITQSEGYDLAWVGFANTYPDPFVRIEAASGPAAGYARDLRIRWDQSPEGEGLAGWTLSSGKSQVIRDLESDSRMAPWLSRLQRWQLRAAIALPLQISSGAQGVLVVYSSHFSDFPVQERELLERLAKNLALGIDKLRIQENNDRQNERIKKLAYNDPLTSLPNRRSLLRHLEQIASAEDETGWAAILFIDLNDFKLINDALGHAVGDDILKRVAQRIQHTLRQGDLVGRQGGDEFIVVMVDNPRQVAPDDKSNIDRLQKGVKALAERIHNTLRKPLDIQGHQYHLGASIGASLFPHSASSVDSVVEQADMAMYKAKATGKKLVFYSQNLGKERQDRLTAESELHTALDANEFILHYQPVWELDGGRIVGVEALIRWKKADGKTISPGVFIPLAEEIGLIGKIGDWVLATAARQLAAWRRQGLEIWMGVNLSVSQLHGTYAARRISEFVVAEGTHPDWWSLELTEDTLMRAPDEVAEAMGWLSKEGFRLSLDDFGQGYSSLARLQSMPLDSLKIDKMFVDRLEEKNGAGRKIATAISELARNLSLKTVAEGVETQTQKRFLGEIGCQFAQGFLVSPALPANEIPTLVQEYQERSAIRRSH